MDLELLNVSALPLPLAIAALDFNSVLKPDFFESMFECTEYAHKKPAVSQPTESFSLMSVGALNTYQGFENPRTNHSHEPCFMCVLQQDELCSPFL